MQELIPEDKINEIRQNIDIVDFISEYVQLKKQGRNYFGLCPFHGESTPSFSVAPEKQIFHCFGCGAGGNVFSFIMDIEGLSFQEAAVKLADRANVSLENVATHLNKPANQKQDLMVKAHELLSKFYHHILVHTNEGADALDYLHNRGMTLDMIEHFQIGYALNKPDFGYNFLKGRGFSDEILESAGLITKGSHSGEYIDRFRGRIIFPIIDNKGNTVAFSGRILTDGQPKYLNSPESMIFHKSKTLYNFFKARPAIRKKQTIVLFEGFADCISAFGAGVDNGIATMGTALTEDHIHIIKRNSENVFLCFDSDSAGQAATYKAGKMLQEAGLRVQVAVIPDGKDPDEYIQRNGPDKFSSVVMGNSLTFIAFKMRYFKVGKNLQNEGERLVYIEQVLTEISKLNSAIEQDIYLRQISEEFSLSLDALKQQVRQIIYRQNKYVPNQKNKPSQNIPTINRDKKLKPAYYNAERMLIAHMLKSLQVTAKVQEMMKDFPFNIDEHQAIATYLYAYYEDGNEPDLSNFLSFLKDQDLRKMAADIGMLSINDEVSDKELHDYINHVLKQQKMQTIKEKEEAGKQAEREKDFKKAAEIAMEVLRLRKML